jgi:DNA-binding HxlR family transcriptional regulator
MTAFGKTLEPVLITLKQWAEVQMLPRMKIYEAGNDNSR